MAWHLKGNQMEKKSRWTFTRTIALLMAAVTTVFVTQPQSGWAMLVTTPTAAAAYEPSSARGADLKAIQTTLESEIVRERLKELKMTPEQVNARLSQLSDAEIHQVAMNVENLNPGGDAGGVLVSVLVIGVLVLLFVYLLKRV